MSCTAKSAAHPRIMTEWAHEQRHGPHPAPDRHAFLRGPLHRRVVGETTIVAITSKCIKASLLARSLAAGQALRGQKRHPTIEDRVTIYAGIPIMGGDTVVGEGSTIGANVFLTTSVPPHSLVVQEDANVKVTRKVDRTRRELEIHI